MRRALGFLLAVVVLGWGASPAVAQQPGRVPRIGFVRPGAPPKPLIEAFRQGLRELGYVEGRNIVIDYRFAETRLDRLPDLLAEMNRLRPDVIVTASTPAALAAKKAAKTVPVVFVEVGDPVGAGIVASLARPGGNITGVSNLAPDLSGKRLELLKEIIPRITRVAVLRNPRNPTTLLKLKETEAAARALGVKLEIHDVVTPNDFEPAFSAMGKKRPDALLLFTDTLTLDHRNRIVDLAGKNRLPTVYELREFVEAGGLAAYGTNFAERFHRAATYVDKILKGARPGDLPVEQPTKFELVINLRAAKALGLTIPPEVLIRADEVIK